MTEPAKFGFQVIADRDYEDTDWRAADDLFEAQKRAEGLIGRDLWEHPDRPKAPSTDRWKVELPHQCDNWLITGEKYEDAPSHEQAVEDLTRFIAEATEALVALVARLEYGS